MKCLRKTKTPQENQYVGAENKKNIRKTNILEQKTKKTLGKQLKTNKTNRKTQKTFKKTKKNNKTNIFELCLVPGSMGPGQFENIGFIGFFGFFEGFFGFSIGFIGFYWFS